MTTIVTRSGKGSQLTWAEMDANFTNLNAYKLEVTSAGDVGIGTNTPAHNTDHTTLTINGLLGSIIDFQVNDLSVAGLILDTTLGFGIDSAIDIVFANLGVETMRLNNAGDVGIGASTITHVAGCTSLAVGGVNNGLIGALYNNDTPGVVLSAIKGTTTLDDQATAIGYTSDGNAEWAIGYYNGQISLGTAQYIPLFFYTNGIARVTISKEGRVGIGGIPSKKALLDVQSTSLGVKFPNMTTTQKNAIGNEGGLVVFDTTLGQLCVNTGSAWQTITSV